MGSILVEAVSVQVSSKNIPGLHSSDASGTSNKNCGELGAE